MNKVRLLVVTFLAGALAVLGPAAPRAFAASSGTGPVIDVSSACAGQNAEVEQAVAPPHYIYEAWIGCGGEGFARSADGGAHFSKPITLPDSSGSDDPAVAVAPDGTVYVSYLRYHDNHAYPVVATSFDHGATFSQAASLIPHIAGNWGDRDFIAAGRGGTVYVTWDYGPSAADVKIVCSPIGQLRLQRSGRHRGGPEIHRPREDVGTDHPDAAGLPGRRRLLRLHRCSAQRGSRRPDSGATSSIRTRSPCTPGTNYSPRRRTAARPGRPLSRSGPVPATIADPDWWIDGDLSTDRAGNLYATWDTQTSSGDIGWLSYSTDHGRTWSAPIRVTPDQDNALHNVESAGAGPGIADIAWQSDNSPQGYATYLRPFSIRHGWLAPVKRVSRQYGNPAIWPGDTFGISMLPGRHGPGARGKVALSWGSAVGGSKNSEIYATVAGR